MADPTSGSPSETSPRRESSSDGFPQQLAGLYTSPRSAFGHILAKPQLLYPLLGLVLLNFVFTVFWMRMVDPVEFVKVQIEESGRGDRIPPERREAVIEQRAKLVRVFAWVGAFLGPPLVVLVVGSIFFFVFRFLFGGDVTLAQAVAIVTWSFLVTTLVTTPLTYLTLTLKGDWNVNPQEALQSNLSFLLDRESTPRPLYALAGSLDLLSFWVLFLLSTGFGVASRRSTSSAAVGVFGVWAVYVLGKAGLAALF